MQIKTDFLVIGSGIAGLTYAIKVAKRIGLDIHVSIILHRNNVDELDSMIEMCEEFGIPFQISYEVTKRYDDTEDSRDSEITLDQFENLLQSKHSHFFMAYNPEHSFQCSCARSVLGIGSNGEIYPCIGAPILSGNIREKSLTETWSSSTELKKIREIKRDDFKDCIKCDVKEFCTRSSGSMFINTGDYFGCEEIIYAQATLRKKYYNSSSD